MRPADCWFGLSPEEARSVDCRLELALEEAQPVDCWFGLPPGKARSAEGWFDWALGQPLRLVDCRFGPEGRGCKLPKPSRQRRNRHGRDGDVPIRRAKRHGA